MSIPTTYTKSWVWQHTPVTHHGVGEAEGMVPGRCWLDNNWISELQVQSETRNITLHKDGSITNNRPLYNDVQRLCHLGVCKYMPMFTLQWNSWTGHFSEQGISAVKQCLPIWKPKKVLWNKLKESPIQRGSPNAFWNGLNGKQPKVK